MAGNLTNAGSRRLELPAQARAPRENPFASRYVRPGALPFLFADKSDVGEVLRRLRSCNWCGSIIGPHGSGKSTLLAQIDGALRHTGCEVQAMLAGRSTSAAIRSLSAVRGSRRRMLLLDGYDLLPYWKRWWIRRSCRRAGIGLVVTSHRTIGLPVLAKTSTSVPLALRLAGMLSGAEFAARCEGLICESFIRHGGNLREVWFELYDRYERCDRSANAGVRAVRASVRAGCAGGINSPLPPGKHPLN